MNASILMYSFENIFVTTTLFTSKKLCLILDTTQRWMRPQEIESAPMVKARAVFYLGDLKNIYMRVLWCHLLLNSEEGWLIRIPTALNIRIWWSFEGFGWWVDIFNPAATNALGNSSFPMKNWIQNTGWEFPVHHTATEKHNIEVFKLLTFVSFYFHSIINLAN